MGQLRQRGNVWWIRYYRNGKRYEETSGSEKKQAAIDLLKIREGDIAKGVPVTAKLARLTFDDAAADLETEYTINKRGSLATLKRRIKKGLKPYFTGRRMASITTVDIRAYTDARLKDGMSNASINRELAALKRMFTLARQAGKMIVSPHIPMLDENNVRTGFFERGDFEAVRKALPAAIRPVATFAYLTGWRVPSEVLTLRWSQVDLTAGIVRLEPGTTKNREGRVFPFAALPELKMLLDAQKDATKVVERASSKIVPWVFHRHGKPIRSFRKAWRNACTVAGCPNRIPHDFRRSSVRNLVRAGVPERVAMQLTGHRTRSVFERYNIVSEADLTAGVEKLAGTITGTATRSAQVLPIASGEKPQ